LGVNPFYFERKRKQFGNNKFFAYYGIIFLGRRLIMGSFKEAILDTLEYIENNLKTEITLEQLARRVNYSKYHFARGFIFYVGTSIMDYVNTRRLIHAISEIKTGKKASDVIYDYGFATLTGFTKAFKRKFGTTPSQFKASLDISIPPLSLNYLIYNNIKGDFLMEPKIISKEKFTIAGFAFLTTTKNNQNFKDIPQFWEQYMSDGRLEKLHQEPFVKNHAEYGACLPMDENGNFKYFIGVETNGMPIPATYDVYEVNSQSYAVFTTPKANNDNFSQKIQETWRFIYAQWLPNSPYVFDSAGIDFELYDQRCYSDENKVIDIYIPIKPKNK
jgi:AraC family transcriptional regulator